MAGTNESKTSMNQTDEVFYTTTTTTQGFALVTYPVFSEEDFLSFQKTYQISQFIRLYFPLIFVVVGTIGNVLTIGILLRRPMRKRSMFAFLTIVAVADTVVLFTLPFRIWVGMLTDEDAYNTNPAVCRSMNFLVFVFSEFSAACLTLVTIERFIVVQNPLKGPLVSNVRLAYVAMAVMLGVLCILHTHLFWTLDIRVVHLHQHNMTYCRAAEGYDELIDHIWPWVDIFVYSLAPFIIILILNILLIRKARGAGRRRRQMSSGNMGSKPPGEGNAVQEDDSRRLTIMLVTVTFTFLVTTLPLCLVSIAVAQRIPHSMVHDAKGNVHKELASHHLARSLAQLLMFLNHSINFFLYCLTGKKFRKELRLILSCKTTRELQRGSICSTLTTRLTSSASAENVNTIAKYNRAVSVPLGKRVGCSTSLMHQVSTP